MRSFEDPRKLSILPCAFSYTPICNLFDYSSCSTHSFLAFESVFPPAATHSASMPHTPVRLVIILLTEYHTQHAVLRPSLPDLLSILLPISIPQGISSKTAAPKDSLLHTLDCGILLLWDALFNPASSSTQQAMILKRLQLVLSGSGGLQYRHQYTEKCIQVGAHREWYM